MERVRTTEAGRHVGVEVLLRGWLHQFRQLGKVNFLIVRDGWGTFQALVDDPATLADLHVTYEGAKEYPLEWVENRAVPFSWRVTRMKLTPDKRGVVVNEGLTLAGVPAEAFEYRLGNRSALEWVIDQYQVATDRRSGLTSDPNQADDPEYIARLVGKVVTVSLATVETVRALPALGVGENIVAP